MMRRRRAVPTRSHVPTHLTLRVRTAWHAASQPARVGRVATRRFAHPTDASAHDDAHQVGRILGAELLHDAGAVYLDGARADPEVAAGLLVGCAAGNLRQHLAL